VRATRSPGALLVSPFNMKWRFSTLAGGVEGFKVMPLLSEQLIICEVITETKSYFSKRKQKNITQCNPIIMMKRIVRRKKIKSIYKYLD
jgi:hypothetical protein